MQFYFDSNVEFHNVITKEKTIMNKVDVLMTQLNTQLLQSQLSSM